MMRRGFTVVELVITITIMGILLTLAVVNLNSTQANGRDSERKGDAENIALHLESFYDNYDPELGSNGGTYLDTSRINEAQLRQALPDLDTKNLRAPGVDTSQPISLVAATNNLTATTTVLPRPSSSNDVYVYQPLTSSGALCVSAATEDCRRFTIYYYQESDNSVQMITSKNQ